MHTDKNRQLMDWIGSYMHSKEIVLICIPLSRYLATRDPSRTATIKVVARKVVVAIIHVHGYTL